MEPSIGIILRIGNQVFYQAIPIVIIRLTILIECKDTILFAIRLVQLAIFRDIVRGRVHFPAGVVGNEIDNQLNAVGVQCIPQFLELVQRSEMLVCRKIVANVIAVETRPPVETAIALVVDDLRITVLIRSGDPNCRDSHTF